MTDNSPPAFPVQDGFYAAGMSLRDWFAGQALATLQPHWDAKPLAKAAYEVADAMLAERERP
jgi:hypothetical protein